MISFDTFYFDKISKATLRATTARLFLKITFCSRN